MRSYIRGASAGSGPIADPLPTHDVDVVIDCWGAVVNSPIVNLHLVSCAVVLVVERPQRHDRSRKSQVWFAVVYERSRVGVAIPCWSVALRRTCLPINQGIAHSCLEVRVAGVERNDFAVSPNLVVALSVLLALALLLVPRPSEAAPVPITILFSNIEGTNGSTAIQKFNWTTVGGLGDNGPAFISLSTLASILGATFTNYGTISPPV